MAWRLTPYQTITSGVSTITKGWGDAIMAAINDLFNGAYTVKKWHIDGTGDVANAGASGSLRVSNGVTVDAGGVTLTTGNVAISAGSLTAHTGITVDTVGVTVTSGGVLAQGDFTTTGGALKATGTLGNVGRVELSKVISSASAGSGQGQTIGHAHKDTLLVAWGIIHNTGSVSSSLVRGANVQSVLWTATGKITVTLVNGVSNKLAPIAGIYQDSGGIAHVPQTGITTSAFEVWTRDPVGTLTDYDTIFHVYGG